MSTERLDRLLSRLGYCSRGDLRRQLDRVTVAGEAVRRSDAKVTHAQVCWDGEPLDPDPLWLLLHKPADLTCSHRDLGGLIFELFPERYMQRRPALSSVGRLDKDTTGVLILTTDGPALHRLTSPKSEVEKVYQVGLDSEPDQAVLDRLQQGGMVLEGDDKPLLPCVIRRTGENQVEMVLHEGRYHQVKRMWSALGLEVQTLHRSRFGRFEVGSLEPGEFRLLEPAEVEGI